MGNGEPQVNWKAAYDEVCQPGLINQSDGSMTTVSLPVWFVDYLKQHRLEDIDPRLSVRILCANLANPIT